MYKLMMDCWKKDPIERPTFEAVVFRLEDFFHADMQYTEASKVLGGDAEEEPEPEPESSEGEEEAAGAGSGSD